PLPFALGVPHRPCTEVDLRLERGVRGEDLALRLVKARGVQRPGEGRCDLRAPPGETLAVELAEARAAGAAHCLEHAHQLARADEGDGEHGSPLRALPPAPGGPP